MRSEPTTERVVIDVSTLPEVVFGHRSLTWWATIAFILVEGTTLVILITSYFYLRMNAAEWPPRPASNPDLLIPGINLAVILATLVPKTMGRNAALRLDKRGVLLALTIAAAMLTASNVLRYFEFRSLNVIWDVNAYGSALWGIYFAHTTLLGGELLETLVMLALFASGRALKKHYSDVEDNALYQWFLSLSWVLIFAVVIIGPRVL